VDLDQPIAAIAAFREALKHNPGMAQVHYQLGLVYQRMGQSPEAALSYREALRLNPQLHDAQARLGHLQAERGDLRDALESYALGLALGVSPADGRDFHSGNGGGAP